VDIATGEIDDRRPSPEEQGKDIAAMALGRKGGMARAKKDGLRAITLCETSGTKEMD
jgi:hypothetical protein